MNDTQDYHDFISDMTKELIPVMGAHSANGMSLLDKSVAKDLIEELAYERANRLWAQLDEDSRDTFRMIINFKNNNKQGDYNE